MPLNSININDPQFQEKLARELQNNRGVVLEGLDTAFSQNVENVFLAFDAFRDQPAESKAAFRGQANQFHGYYPQKAYQYGGKTTERFFISRDINKNLPMPLPASPKLAVSFDQATQQLTDDISRISAAIVTAIEMGLGIEKDKLKRLLTPSSLIAMSHYLPTTQELLSAMVQDKQLNLTKDNEIKTFEEHKDLSLFSMLIYRQNRADGLRVKLPGAEGKKRFEEVSLNQRTNIQIVILVGSMLQRLTEKKLKGLKHTVATKPLAVGEVFSRECISVFMSHDPKLDLYPLLGSNQSQAINFQAMFDEGKKKYNLFTQQTALQALPPQAAKFPSEKEIHAEKTEHGTVYRRV